MKTVINKNGKEIDYEAAIELMDDKIREALNIANKLSTQEFFSAYEIAHEMKYKKEWELSKANPTY